VNKCLLALLCWTTLNGQTDAGFIAHLSRNNLQREHRHYLSTLTPGDSAEYFKTKYYLQYFNDSLFLRHYRLSSELCAYDRELLSKADAKFLDNDDALSRRSWFGMRESAAEMTSLVFKASEAPKKFQKEIFPEALRESFVKYRSISKKSPVAAGFLSAIVPGLGKVYGAKPRAGALTFFTCAAYAFQTLEASKKLGIKHPLTIIDAGAFGIFYLANIYGSYHGVKQLKRERKKQFLHDAAVYYN
jgi:hypothetical protein